MARHSLALILAIAAVLLMAAALFTVVFAPSFDSEFGEMARIWMDRGVKEEKLHLAIDELKEMPESTLHEIKGELALFKASARSDSAVHLATVYDSLIDYVLREKKLASLQSALSSAAGSACDKLSLYSQLVQESELLLDSTNDYVANASDFYRIHPTKAEKIALFSSETVSKEELEIEKLKYYLAALEEVCK